MRAAKAARIVGIMNAMDRFKNPDDYYDAYFKRERSHAWWRVVARYTAALTAFLLLMIAVLSAWWIWQDYALLGVQGVTWENFSRRAAYRWNEFLHGRLGLDQDFCRFSTC
jgi:hypothetical protein